MTLERVVSGGQTGVDQAALRAARACGLRTGGWAPRGWQTTVGPAYELLSGFGLGECSGGYALRTAWNVRDSDATLRVAVNFNSPGEVCTYNAIQRYGRPWMDVPLAVGQVEEAKWVATVRRWLEQMGVRTLNVAGNREGTRGLEIGVLAESFLRGVFK